MIEFYDQKQKEEVQLELEKDMAQQKENQVIFLTSGNLSM